MTGLDVMIACRDYPQEMERLRIQARFAMDAATRATRSADAFGHGGGEDRIAACAARRDLIGRAMRLRAAMNAHEMDAAAWLCARLEPEQGEAIRRTMISGQTIRQCAASMHTSEDAIRGLCRRARIQLKETAVQLPDAYLVSASGYREALRSMRGKGEA